jgi:hypothetical protein
MRRPGDDILKHTRVAESAWICSRCGAERRSGLTTNGKPIAILLGIEEDHFEETSRAIWQAKAQLALSRLRKQAARRGTDPCRSPLLTPKFAPFAPGASRHESRDRYEYAGPGSPESSRPAPGALSMLSCQRPSLCCTITAFDRSTAKFCCGPPSGPCLPTWKSCLSLWNLPDSTSAPCRFRLHCRPNFLPFLEVATSG